MTHTTGRIGRTLASVTVCAASGIAFADATDWVRGMPGGSDLTLSLTSIDEADGPLRELARAAQIDWLPTASRLLSVTNLSPGADTSRPISFGFVSGDEPRSVRFVAVIPSDRPAMIAANFEALPSTEHAGLFAFEFAGQSYFARVLPDDHLAISNAASLLLGLREVDGKPLAAPMRLTLTGDGSLATLTSLMAGIRQEESNSENEPEMSMPDGVESITIDLTPSSGSLRADIRIRAAAGSELARKWQSTEGLPLEPLPFPDTPELFVAQGSLADPAVRQVLLPLCEELLGIEADSLESVRTIAVLVEQPPSLLDWASLSATVAITGEEAQRLRSVLADAVSAQPGARITRNASTRAGVEIDRFAITPGARSSGERSDAGAPGGDRWWQAGPGSRAGGEAIEGRMFARNDRVYLTTAPQGNGLDRLIAFGPSSTSIGSRSSLSEWLSQLPERSSGRASVNIGAVARFAAMTMSIEVPNDIGPVVGSVSSGDAEVHATLIVPAGTLGFMDRVRLRASERRGSR